MELTWINKLRIAAVAALGILVIGVLAWPLVSPADPLAPVRAGSLSASGMMILLFLALGLGFVGYFVAWPHGREIGILAVPFGLTVWAARCGPMSALTEAGPQPYEREALALSLRFEPAFWLLVVAGGLAGVLLAQYLRPAPGAAGPKEHAEEDRHDPLSPLLAFLPSPLASYLLSGLLALVATTVIAYFCVGAFVRDVATSYNTAATQPATGQILFGVLAAFTVAAFALKKFARLGYFWPSAAAAFVIAFTQMMHGSAATLRQFAETRPATFFPHSGLTILPIQMVALGTLGSVLGYWMAVRYDWWRQNETAG
jgi:hypothetical protein